MPSIWSPGKRILGYQIDSVLAEGPSGGIYRGHDGLTEVILKQLQFAGLTDWEQLQAFEREAQMLTRLEHPRIPRLVAWHESEGTYVLVQSALPGENLKARLALWQPTEAEIANIAAQVLGILTSLQHFQPPILHRDIKPSNLMIDNNELVYLIDFGAAVQGLGPVSVSGTPGYMPPEQYAGRPGPQSDLYALGATLIELFGHSPNNLTQTHGQIDFRPYLRCSIAFANWLEILVHPDPELRFQTAREALSALPNLYSREKMPPSPALKQTQTLKPSDRSQTMTQPEPFTAPLNQRYELRQCLQIEGGVSTWQGQDLLKQTSVLIKRLQIAQLNSIKQLELFERELETLQTQPDLPTPRLLEHLQAEHEHYLILEDLPGVTLQQRLDQGWRASEAEVWQLARQGLETLQRLHQLGLVHRDLTPAHLLWHEQQLYLLNFGGVQQWFRAQGSGGSTVIGSFGYCAPEQLLGQASPQSDLYALGMCLLQVITGRHPAELPWSGQKVELSGLGISDALSRWLSSLIEVRPDQRSPSAERALQALRQQESVFRDLQKRDHLASPEVQLSRKQTLATQEAHYQNSSSAYSHLAGNPWGLYLQQLNLPEPPPRLKIQPKTDQFEVVIPLARQTRQPRLLKALKRAKRAQTAFIWSLAPAGLSLWGLWLLQNKGIPPLVWGLLLIAPSLSMLLLVGIFRGRRLMAQPWLSDLILSFDGQQLSCRAAYAEDWDEQLRQRKPAQRHDIRIFETDTFTQLKWQAEPTPAPFEGEFYRLSAPAQPDSPVCYLQPQDLAWLEQALPVILSQPQLLNKSQTPKALS